MGLSEAWGPHSRSEARGMPPARSEGAPPALAVHPTSVRLMLGNTAAAWESSLSGLLCGPRNKLNEVGEQGVRLWQKNYRELTGILTRGSSPQSPRPAWPVTSLLCEQRMGPSRIKSQVLGCAASNSQSACLSPQRI